MDKKVCKICNTEKELSEYYSQVKRKSNGEEYIYYPPYCKECQIKKASKNFQENRDVRLPEKRSKYKEYKKKYAKKEREWEIKNKDKRRNGLRTWQKNNPDKVREYTIYREMNKKHEISKQEWEMCKSYFDNSCAYCGLPREEHFRMWNGEMKIIDLHREHVIHNGTNDLSNCIPACQSCNSSKGIKELQEWYSQHEKYSSEKEDKIKKWLENDHKLYITN